jgi:hypothetical protein
VLGWEQPGIERLRRAVRALGKIEQWNRRPCRQNGGKLGRQRRRNGRPLVAGRGKRIDPARQPSGTGDRVLDPAAFYWSVLDAIDELHAVVSRQVFETEEWRAGR